MHLLRVTSALILPCCSMIFDVAFAEPEITIQTRHFPVTGYDSATIRQSISTNGPRAKDGTTYHAHTVKDIKWGYRWIESDSRCRISRIDISIRVEYLLPQLQNVDKLDEGLKSRWDAYYQKLFEHEQQHKDFGIMAARELERELESIEQLPCFGMENHLDRVAESVLDKYDRLEKEFDRYTNHGVNQGVMLP